jgi:hypothetical protein
MTTPSSRFHVIRCDSGRRPTSVSAPCGPAGTRDDAIMMRYQWTASLQGHVLWIDPQWERWMGLSPGSWRRDAWLQSIAPTDRAQVVAHHLRSLRCHAAATFACHVVRGDIPHRVQMTVIPVVLAGRVAGARGWIDVATVAVTEFSENRALGIVR